MLYIRLQCGRPVEISKQHPKCEPSGWINEVRKLSLATGWMSARDFETFEEASTISKYLTAMTGNVYLPTDEGSGTYPRYRVIEAPKVGDKVSKGFNGDYYPQGEIVRITPTFRVVTSTGAVFIRKRQTSAWLTPGGTWGLVSGHVDERNPSF